MRSPSRRVWIIEDREDFSALIAEMLEELDWTAECFPTADLALAALDDRAAAHDLVLLDLNPGDTLSGVDFLAQYRARPPLAATPVILMSGSQVAEREWRKAGAQAFLFKPFSLTQLQELMARLCSSRAPERAATRSATSAPG